MKPNTQPQGVSTRPAPEYDAAFPSAAVLSPAHPCATSHAVQADHAPAFDRPPGPVCHDPWSATLADLFRSSSPPDPNWTAPTLSRAVPAGLHTIDSRGTRNFAPLP